MELTDNETKVMRALANNAYSENGDGVWSWAVNDSMEPSGIEGHALAGVVGSLVKKGIYRSAEYEKGEQVLWLTDTGREVMAQVIAA
jgi:DNA-binding MarR family transcriptional regulator